VRAELPLDGIEAYDPTHTGKQVAAYLAYAMQHYLLVSAGSDLHDPHGSLPIAYRA
jgi:3',5'-nucleoside bisphosphate phosphatase